MKISVVTPDLSGNCVGRAYILARSLEGLGRVELVGPQFGPEVWAPLRNASIAVRAIPFGYEPHYALQLGRIAAEIDGDLIVASKPLATSFGAAVHAKSRRDVPLLLDIDDWESGFCRDHWNRSGGLGRARYLVSSLLRPHASLSLLNAPRQESRVDLADARIVSNRFLQQKFGGELVWHGRDTEQLDPEKFDRGAERRRLKLPHDAPLVTFFGTITPYKGIDVLVDAIEHLPQTDAKLLLIGADARAAAQPILERARRKLGDRLLTLGPQPFADVGRCLSVADVVVIPQEDRQATVGQMPAKLFDAMAMGKPTVASDVSDIAYVIDDAGWVVPPSDPRALASALHEALTHPGEAARRGARARERCVAQFSWAAMTRTLEPIVERLMLEQGSQTSSGSARSAGR